MRNKKWLISSLLISFLSFNCLIFAGESDFREEVFNEKFHAGTKLNIVRKDNSVLKGKLIRFDETMVVISIKGKEIEVFYSDIKKIEKTRNAGGLIIGISAITALILLPFLFGS